MEVPWLVAVGDNEGLLPDLRLGQLDEVEEPPESDIPRGVRPEPFVARVFPSREVEERIPPQKATSASSTAAPISRLRRASRARMRSHAPAYAPADKPVLIAPGLFSFPLAFLL